MALANILVPNLYNTYANSETLNPVQTQPVPGNNTLWINSANGHLSKGATDLQGGTIYYPAAAWPINTNLNPDVVVATSDLTINYLDVRYISQANQIFPLNPLPFNIPPGARLTSFSIVYSVETAVLAAAQIILYLNTYTNNGLINKNIVPVTGIMPLGITGDNTTIATYTVNNPITLNTNQTYDMTITFDGGPTTILSIYGLFLNFN